MSHCSPSIYSSLSLNPKPFSFSKIKTPTIYTKIPMAEFLESPEQIMARLVDEFRNILLTHSSPNDNLFVFGEEEDDTNSIREIHFIPSGTIHDLRNIAQLMITSGYSNECVQLYVSMRKSFVQASFIQLGIVGNVLETKIGLWIRTVKVCIRIIFASEKRLCKQVFRGLGGNIDDTCFMEIIKESIVHLFNYVETYSITRRAPEKLFKMLDLHDALTDLLPDIGIVFNSKAFESIRVQAEEAVNKLGEAVRWILSEFESKVSSEPSKVPVPGGTIHPLTRYVMNYISLISDYKETLNKIVVSKPSTEFLDIDLSEMENQGPLAMHLVWMIEILQFNLEGKTKYYKDDSLSHLFMMNNVHYIVNKIKGSPELNEMIDSNYVRNLTGKFRTAAINYQRSTWVRVLHCLRDKGLHVQGGFSSGVSKSALKERFKSFNAIFEDVYSLQATWLVPDSQLREELRIFISKLLIPAYRSFLGRFRGHIESGKHPENYIKYSVDDLESAVFDLFEGTSEEVSVKNK